MKNCVSQQVNVVKIGQTQVELSSKTFSRN